MLETQPTVVPHVVSPTTVVSLSDAAATKLRELTAEETNPDVGLRVYVYSGGCRGAVGRRRSPARSDGQCEQPFAEPASSAVRKLEPQPQAATAFGLFTVNPAPISVST